MSGIIGADNAFGRYFNSPDTNSQGNITALFDVRTYFSSCSDQLWLTLQKIGCVVGAGLSYLLGERLGRRRMTMLASAVMVAGTIVLAASTTVAQLIIGRIMTGVVSSPKLSVTFNDMTL